MLCGPILCPAHSLSGLYSKRCAQKGDWFRTMKDTRKSTSISWKRVAGTMAAMLVIPMLTPFYTPQPAAAAIRTVEMKDFKFKSPNTVSEGQSMNVAVGDTVTWVNFDAESH